MSPEQQNYNFIYQTNNNPLKSSGPSSQKQRIMQVGIIAGIAIVVLIAVMVLMSLFSTDSTKTLTSLAADQNEIQRIMNLGVADASNSSLKAKAQTAASTVASHKQTIISIAAKKNIKITDKQLALTVPKSTEASKITKTLDNAKSANSFDEEFMNIYEKQIAKYLAEVKRLKTAESDKTTRAALENFEKQLPLLSSKYVAKTSE